MVDEATPWWFLMENVDGAPMPCVSGYTVRSYLLRDVWVGGRTSRLRRFSFGSLYGLALDIEVQALCDPQPAPAVCASDGGRAQPVKIGGSGARAEALLNELWALDVGPDTDEDAREFQLRAIEKALTDARVRDTTLKSVDGKEEAAHQSSAPASREGGHAKPSGRASAQSPATEWPKDPCQALASAETADARVQAGEGEAVPPLSGLVTCTLANPDLVCHLPRLDCQHEAPHLIAACGAFKGEAGESPAEPLDAQIRRAIFNHCRCPAPHDDRDCDVCECDLIFSDVWRLVRKASLQVPEGGRDE